MLPSKTLLERRIKTGWMLFALGLLLIAFGVIWRLLSPTVAPAPRWLISFGLLLFGWGAIYLARYLAAQKDPTAARRAVLEELDERHQAIRDRAANVAFTFGMVVASVALLIYSNLSANQPGFDPLWYYMAFMVLGPGIVYVVCLVWFQNKY